MHTKGARDFLYFVLTLVFANNSRSKQTTTTTTKSEHPFVDFC